MAENRHKLQESQKMSSNEDERQSTEAGEKQILRRAQWSSIHKKRPNFSHDSDTQRKQMFQFHRHCLSLKLRIYKRLKKLFYSTVWLYLHYSNRFICSFKFISSGSVKNIIIWFSVNIVFISESTLITALHWKLHLFWQLFHSLMLLAPYSANSY